MRHLWFLFLVLLSAALCATLRAQNVLAPGASTADPPIILGEPVVALMGPWKFHVGDNLAWASSSFDDSAWGTMDLTPPPGSYDPSFGSSGYVPGWTVRGFAGYSGFAWYRLRVDLQNQQAALKLKMPDDFDDGYQVFVNGQLVGQFGRFTAKKVIVYNALPRAFSLPANPGTGPMTIAIRMWMTAFTPLVDPDAGGLHGPPVLGEASAIDQLIHLDWDTIDHSNSSAFFHTKILVIAMLVAFGLFWLDRKEPAYFWLGLTCTVSLARTCIFLAADYGTWIPANLNFLLNDAILAPAIIGLWVIFWAYWFRLKRIARLHSMVWGLVAMLALGMAMLRTSLYGSVVPVHAVVWLSPLTLTLKLLLGLLLAWVTYRGIRQNKMEGWLALPAVLLVATAPYLTELIVLHVPTQLFLFGVGVSIGQIGNMLSLTIVTVLLLRRFLHSQRERELWKLELEQARQVQRMLIPVALPVVPGLTIESEYRPARVVGGDFFQIIPLEGGSTLVILGDVSGKGLKAAMAVSLIVGAARMVVDFTSSPAEILAGLNRRLCGRLQGGFATCIAMRLDRDGNCAISSAGHPAPFLNKHEMNLPGALPLGIQANTTYEETMVRVGVGDHFALYTDGLLEARSESGELYSFARLETLFAGKPNAAEATLAAVNFGQDDDITVLTLTRLAVGEESTAQHMASRL